VAYDPDAVAFFTATGITNPTQKTAVNQLVLDLKSNSIWSKMLAFYPMVGGTATTHKYNLKDPRDLDAAFRLTFSGGWTHSSTGALPNGTNGYANTFLSPLSNLSTNSESFGFYGGTSVAAGSAKQPIGCTDTATYDIIGPREAGDSAIFILQNNGVQITVSNASTLGFIFGTRNGASSSIVSIRGTKTTNGAGSNTRHNYPFFIGARNQSGTAAQYSPIEHRLSFVGNGLTSGDCDNLYTLVQAYQTTLGRNV
jgi:hypothetical protein